LFKALARRKRFRCDSNRRFTHRNLTADLLIADIADEDSRTVISKDSDFLKFRILQGRPQKLLMITTGNIVNKELLTIFELNFVTVMKLFNLYEVVEMNNQFVIGHKLSLLKILCK
jgi:predicted nuclease of predicted toxin-antitoxin system